MKAEVDFHKLGRGLGHLSKSVHNTLYRVLRLVVKTVVQGLNSLEGLALNPVGISSTRQEVYGQTLRGVQDPYQAYESQLQPSLRATEDYINRAYQQRGLLRSGLPIEQMGRAGVELSIREAQDRMNFRGQELARGGELSQY